MNIRNRAGRLAMDEARAHEQADVIAILSRYIDRTLDREVRIQFNTLVFPKGGVLDVAAFGASCTSYHITASFHLTLSCFYSSSLPTLTIITPLHGRRWLGYRCEYAG